jgi:transcriptional regulator with XRE-family HTH domain
MQDDRVGRLFRTVRIQRGLRQRDLGDLAGCSQRWVAELELGRLDAMSIGTVRAVGDILELRVTVDAWWRRGDGIRLLDAVHASLVERTLRTLTEAGWLVVPEWSFNHFGERGSVDIIAWHDATRTLLIIEVKSRLDDVQELLHTFGRKVRLAPDLLAKERGWVPANIATMLVVGDGNASREVVRRHATTFDTRWPERTARCKAFVRGPDSGTSPFRGGIWFVPAEDGPTGRPVVQPQRVRRRTAPEAT